MIVDALCFDLDATLLDGSRFADSVAATCREIAARYPALDAAHLLATNRDEWQRYWPDAEPRWMLGGLDGATVTREGWRRTLRACGCEDADVLELATDVHLRLGREAHRLFADARALFAAIEDARLPVALITNGASDTQREKLRHNDIERWFDVIAISGELGIKKPSSAIFDVALARLGTRRDRVWHVGDSLENDVAGASAAGLTAVWLNRSGAVRAAADPRPDIEIASLAELAALIGTRHSTEAEGPA